MNQIEKAGRVSSERGGGREVESKSMELQVRDEGILRICFEHQFLTHQHVEQFFPGASARSLAYRRIERLVTGGYLQWDPMLQVNGHGILRLTRQGAELAKTLTTVELKRARALSEVRLRHDAAVIETRLRLEHFWDGKFVCERAIRKKEFEELPDGLFYFPSGRVVVLEVENSLKGRTRFQELLGRWKKREELFFVLYVATSDLLFRTLSPWLPPANENRPMGIITLSGLHGSAPKVWTKRGEAGLFERRAY